MVDPFADGQIMHLLSLRSGGRKRPFAVEMLASSQSCHPQLMVKRPPHADRDEVHVGMLDHFVRVGKSVGNSEMPGRFVCGFLAARADRRDLELRKRAQGRNVGIAPPAVAHACPNNANTDFFWRHDVSSLPPKPANPRRVLLLPAATEVSVNENQTYKFIQLSLSESQLGSKVVRLVGQHLQITGGSASIAHLRKLRRVLS